jgi:hypothetical protein
VEINSKTKILLFIEFKEQKIKALLFLNFAYFSCTNLYGANQADLHYNNALIF